jgi:hypothetical protein
MSAEVNELDDIDVDAVKSALSSKLYQNICDLHNQIETETNSVIATDVVLTALSINLGHIVGQLPPKMRKRSMKVINEIIRDQIIEVGKLEDLDTHGFIGHA